MKRNDFNDIKRLDTKALLEKVRVLRGEMTDLIIDKNMNKLPDLKAISKKKKDVAQLLTVIKQKQLLEAFETPGVEDKRKEDQSDESKQVKQEAKKAVKKGGE
jgi:ribosomal protein L29